MTDNLETLACQAKLVEEKDFNQNAILPYGCTNRHIYLAMSELIEFLTFINKQLHSKNLQRFETMLMPANFSSVVGEFMVSNIPKYCQTLVKNQHHNGHPDLIPTGMFPGNAVQHSNIGIEIKASRYSSGWQGHNPEDGWLMVFVFDSNRPNDLSQGIQALPFRFVKVIGAQLTKDDWSFSGRKDTSRRTITASVKRSGYQKMMSNWIYSTSE
jgi:hypothetical protein